MSFQARPELEAEVNEFITHYPVKRAASLMVLHAIQEQFGWISSEAVQWTAKKLELQPINVFEILTFYPMLRQEPQGKYALAALHRAPLPDLLPVEPGVNYALPRYDLEAFLIEAELLVDWYLPRLDAKLAPAMRDR